MVELTPEEEHFYATSPTTVIYDIFSDAATRLSGTYIGLSDESTTESESEQWWEKLLELKRLHRAVAPDNRQVLIDHIKRWQAELARLRGRQA